ncbi:MAG: hypothetical protein ACREKL_14040 [Chthoniobacterales bacterium]
MASSFTAPVRRRKLSVLALGILASALILCASRADVIPAIHSWGGEGDGNGQFYGPNSIAVGPYGDVYVVDLRPNVYSRIEQFSTEGVFKRVIGKHGGAHGELGSPEGIAVDRSSGDFYVADTGNNRIQKFAHNGHFLRAWGSFGTANGQFRKPWAIAVGPDHNVYVVDGLNSRVQKFDSDGQHLATWKILRADGGPGSPTGIAVDGSNRVYVVNSYEKQILRFNAHGVLQSSWRTHGHVSGDAGFPVSIAASSLGIVLVAGAHNKHIQIFDGPTGRYEHSFEVSVYHPAKREHEVLTPGTMAFQNDDTVFIAHYLANRISKIRIF